MPRIDAWDVQAPSVEEVDAGFPRGFEEAYELGSQLGSGGFGTVRVVRERASGAELAAKTIPKRLNVPNISPAKQAQHLDNLKREVEVWGPPPPGAASARCAAFTAAGLQPCAASCRRQGRNTRQTCAHAS